MLTDGWHPAMPRPHVIEAEERALQFLIFPRHVQAEPSLDVSTCPGWAVALLGAIVGNAGESSARRRRREMSKEPGRQRGVAASGSC
jgi:hypothetical protein